MIGFISGKIIGIDQHQLLLEVGGANGSVGYQILVSDRTLERAKIGDMFQLYIHTHAREDALELFGFLTAWEKKVFLTLNQVSGIGPKTALQILGHISPETLLTAIIRDDRLTLTKAPGIGKKTAERMLLELSEKADKLLKERLLESSSSNSTELNKQESSSRVESGIVDKSLNAHRTLREAADALVGLGYKEAEAMNILRGLVAKLEEQGKPVTSESLVRAALQLYARAQRGLEV